MKKKMTRTFSLFLALTLLFAAFPAVYSAASDGSTKTEPKSDLSDADKGDIVTFGSYEQNNEDDGTEPIEWKVIDRDGDKLLLFSVYSLDYQRYHSTRASTTWADSDIRQWLNEDFFSDAFSAEEQAKIVTVTNSNEDDYKTGEDTDDQVFLLSVHQIKYTGSAKSMRAQPTPYAASKGAARNRGGYGWYWLRTVVNQTNAAFVPGIGDYDISGYYITYGGGIRPAVWVDRSLF